MIRSQRITLARRRRRRLPRQSAPKHGCRDKWESLIADQYTAEVLSAYGVIPLSGRFLRYANARAMTRD